MRRLSAMGMGGRLHDEGWPLEPIPVYGPEYLDMVPAQRVAMHTGFLGDPSLSHPEKDHDNAFELPDPNRWNTAEKQRTASGFTQRRFVGRRAGVVALCTADRRD
ncbi:hypothetical protein EMIT0P294_250019 [Pseudomonas sp. IT-P294]